MWVRDGREILFFAGDGRLMSAEVRTGTKIEVGTPQAIFKPPIRWIPRGGLYPPAASATRDGKRFLIIESEGADEAVEITVVLNWAADLKP
jgi:hypothetical protein